MNMMYMHGPGSIVLSLLHMLAALACFVGFIFLVSYCIKTLSTARLKKWGMWLLLGGIVVCIITMGLMAHLGGGKFGHTMMMKSKGTDSGRVMMTHDMGASMDGMNSMLKGKTGDAFDKAFLEMMIEHHEGAVEMARAALLTSTHDEIKALSRAIISAQQAEIIQMKQWQSSWGFNK